MQFWVTANTTYSQFCHLLKGGRIAACAAHTGATYNSLHRVMPTMGNCMQLSDTEQQSLSNWQDIAKGAGGSHRGRASFPMDRHYADGAHEASSWLKMRMWSLFDQLATDRAPSPDRRGARLMQPDAWTWSEFRRDCQELVSSSEPVPLPAIVMARRATPNNGPSAEPASSAGGINDDAVTDHVAPAPQSPAAADNDTNDAASSSSSSSEGRDQQEEADDDAIDSISGDQRTTNAAALRSEARLQLGSIPADTTWYVAGSPGNYAANQRSFHLVFAFAASGKPIPRCRHVSMVPLKYGVVEFGSDANPYQGPCELCKTCSKWRF